METLNHMEAWAKFYAWVKIPENWQGVDRAGRDRIGKAHRRYLHEKPSPLKYEGVKALIIKYAPGKAEFIEGIIWKDG